MKRRVAPLAVVTAAILVVSSNHCRAALTPQEEAGRVLFEDGVSSVGDAFTARIGMGDAELPGIAARCANCHGADGMGRPEGAVRPTNVTWSELTRSYGHAHENGRRHTPFDKASLKRALTQGVDSAGNRLDGAMPRFKLSDRDFDALVAYLKKLETLQDPGVDEDALRIGTLLPSSGRFAALGAALKGVLEAYFAEVNADGGVYGRRLELVVADSGAGPDMAQRALRKLMRQDGVFAVLAPFAPGVEAELGELANDTKTPVIGPLSLFSDDPHTVNRYVFHLLSGVGELSEALASYVADRQSAAREPAMLVYADSASGAAVADAVEARLQSQGWLQLSRTSFRPGNVDVANLAKSLSARGARTVFVLTPGLDVSALAREAAAADYAPRLLLPGSLAPHGVLELPKAFDGRVLLGYPTLPTDQKPEALREYASLFKKHELARDYQTLQVPAYASAVLFVRALEQIGREATREKWVAAMESTHGFESGLLPALSFNARRRVGAPGGYIVAVDLKARDFRRVGEFVELQ